MYPIPYRMYLYTEGISSYAASGPRRKVTDSQVFFFFFSFIYPAPRLVIAKVSCIRGVQVANVPEANTIAETHPSKLPEALGGSVALEPRS